MGDLVASFLLLAADAPQAPAAGGGANPDAGGGMLSFVPMLVIIGVFFYLFLILPQKRERQKQDQLLKALKKNDRVVTIGGAIGTIVNIEPDSKLVTLRVDDNTRMVFLRSAIQGAYVEAKDESSTKESSS